MKINRHKQIKEIPDYLNNYEERRRRMNQIKSFIQFLFICLFIYLIYDKTETLISNHPNKVDTVYVEKIVHDTIYVRKRK